MAHPFNGLLETLVPGQEARKEAGLCATCGKEHTAFKDELSKREAAITGMCQACQDGIESLEDLDEDDGQPSESQENNDFAHDDDFPGQDGDL